MWRPGFAAVASVAAYAENRIRKHELTTIAKEDDRVRQIEAVNAQTGPVMLAYPTAPEVDAMLARAAAGAPAVDVTADDGVRHQLWVVTDDATIAALTRAVDALPALYIADGHHRSAAADASPKPRRRRLAQLFPRCAAAAERDDHPRLQPRAARPERPHARKSCSPRSGSATASRPSDRPVRPASDGEVGMVLGGRWYRLRLRPELGQSGAAARSGGRLPVTLLHRYIIEPIFGVTDPRPTSASTSSAAAAGSASSSGWYHPARWRWHSRSIRRKWTT